MLKFQIFRDKQNNRWDTRWKWSGPWFLLSMDVELQVLILIFSLKKTDLLIYWQGFFFLADMLHLLL
jgi:hypothetical protein